MRGTRRPPRNSTVSRTGHRFSSASGDCCTSERQSPNLFRAYCSDPSNSTASPVPSPPIKPPNQNTMNLLAPFQNPRKYRQLLQRLNSEMPHATDTFVNNHRAHACRFQRLAADEESRDQTAEQRAAKKQQSRCTEAAAQKSAEQVALADARAYRKQQLQEQEQATRDQISQVEKIANHPQRVLAPALNCQRRSSDRAIRISQSAYHIMNTSAAFLASEQHLLAACTDGAGFTGKIPDVHHWGTFPKSSDVWLAL